LRKAFEEKKAHLAIGHFLALGLIVFAVSVQQHHEWVVA
jgi:hypothetical protein